MKKKFPTWLQFLLLIGALGIALKLAWTPRIRCTHASSACVGNLKWIDGAKADWAAARPKRTGDTPTWNDLLGTNESRRPFPVCQHGGTYSINPIGVAPACSLKTSSFWQPSYSCVPHKLPE